MDFSILGPMEVTAGSGDMTPTAPKLRQVLAFLLLRRNGLVQTGEFIDELWGEDPPRSAMSTLQTYVYKLRRQLFERPGDGDERLMTKPSGYILRIGGNDLDLGRFEARAEEGYLALESGEPQRAAMLLSSALSLWRGPALADVVTGDVLGAYATRLEESRMRALEQRIEADLRLNRHHWVIGELRMLTTTYPLHEGFHAKLMLAMYRSGRRYEALNVYRRLREVLIEELGLEPSPELTRIHQALLSSDPSLDSTGQQPRREATVVSGPAATASGPAAAVSGPVAAVRTPAYGLPADIDDFAGRMDELARVERWLVGGDAARPSGGIVSISGMPGAGKSALGVRIAHLLRAHFPDGALFVNLGDGDNGPRQPGEVLGAVLADIGIAPPQIPDGADERGRMFSRWCAERRVLLVLDDAVSVGQLEAFLPPGRGCAVIVTSRLPLALGGRVIGLDPLTPEDGLRVLESAVGDERVAQDRAAALRLVRECGGLPLALRAIGARLAASPGLSLERLGFQLANHATPLDLLRFGAIDVRATYHSSYNRLCDRDRHALRLVSLFRQDSFTATDVAPLLGLPADGAEQLLARLAEHHLLRPLAGQSNGVVHYQIHELTRWYARERLEDALDTDDARAAAPPDEWSNVDHQGRSYISHVA